MPIIPPVLPSPFDADAVALTYVEARMRDPSEPFADDCLRRASHLLETSSEVLSRLRESTEETRDRVEATRAFLADSYRTLRILQGVE